jgi:hypothetical protein
MCWSVSWPARHKKIPGAQVPRGKKKQPAWGYRIARLFREVNRRVTIALTRFDSIRFGKFRAICKYPKNKEK